MKFIAAAPGRLYLSVAFDGSAGRRGAIVKAVLPGCPFGDDVAPGDRIVTINGRGVLCFADLERGGDRARRLGVVSSSGGEEYEEDEEVGGEEDRESTGGGQVRARKRSRDRFREEGGPNSNDDIEDGDDDSSSSHAARFKSSSMNEGETDVADEAADPAEVGADAADRRDPAEVAALTVAKFTKDGSERDGDGRPVFAKGKEYASAAHLLEHVNSFARRNLFVVAKRGHNAIVCSRNRPPPKEDEHGRVGTGKRKAHSTGTGCGWCVKYSKSKVREEVSILDVSPHHNHELTSASFHKSLVRSGKFSAARGGGLPPPPPAGEVEEVNVLPPHSAEVALVEVATYALEKMARSLEETADDVRVPRAKRTKFEKAVKMAVEALTRRSPDARSRGGEV